MGDLAQFNRELFADFSILKYATEIFDLPKNIKLSIHSGSDKFSLYPIIHEGLKKFDAGVHIKTAGTTWLEELIGLAEAGGEGLAIAKEIYQTAHKKCEELCVPYASVVDIDSNKLPAPDEVNEWDGEKYAQTLRHDQSNPNYNQNFRQLLHVGYKIAAGMGDRYYNALKVNKEIIAKNVEANLLERHLLPLFLNPKA